MPVSAAAQAESIIECLFTLHARAARGRRRITPGRRRHPAPADAGGGRARGKLATGFLFLGGAASGSLLRRGEHERILAVMRRRMAALISENPAPSRCGG